MATIKTFEDIEAWQLARELCRKIHELSRTTDLSKDYRLRDQINGSSGSIMDNIAEGFETGGNKEFLRYLGFAKGSCGETRSQLYRCYDRGYINDAMFNELKGTCLTISRKIANFMKHLKVSDNKGFKYNTSEPEEKYEHLEPSTFHLEQ